MARFSKDILVRIYVERCASEIAMLAVCPSVLAARNYFIFNQRLSFGKTNSVEVLLGPQALGTF